MGRGACARAQRHGATQRHGEVLGHLGARPRRGRCHTRRDGEEKRGDPKLPQLDLLKGRVERVEIRLDHFCCENAENARSEFSRVMSSLSTGYITLGGSCILHSNKYYACTKNSRTPHSIVKHGSVFQPNSFRPQGVLQSFTESAVCEDRGSNPIVSHEPRRRAVAKPCDRMLDAHEGEDSSWPKRDPRGSKSIPTEDPLRGG